MIRLELEDVNVLSSYQPSTARFPTVIVEELDNSAFINTKDSSGFQHSSIAFSVEIYTTGNGRMSEAKSIRNKIDKVMSGDYGMTRGVPQILPNYLDDSIYRYRLTYTGLIDGNKTIYRG